MAFTKTEVGTMVAQIMLVSTEFWGKEFRVKLIEFVDRLDWTVRVGGRGKSFTKDFYWNNSKDKSSIY